MFSLSKSAYLLYVIGLFFILITMFSYTNVEAIECFNKDQCVGKTDGTPVFCIVTARPVVTVDGVCIKQQFYATDYTNTVGKQTPVDFGMHMLSQLIGDFLSKIGGGKLKPPSQPMPLRSSGSFVSKNLDSVKKLNMIRKTNRRINENIAQESNNVPSKITISSLFGFGKKRNKDDDSGNLKTKEDKNRQVLEHIANKDKVKNKTKIKKVKPNTKTLENVRFFQSVGKGFGQIHRDISTVSEIFNHKRTTEYRDNNITVSVRKTDKKTDTNISGFFGVDNSSGPIDRGVVNGLCVSRPWGHGFISKILPMGLFDKACKNLLHNTINSKKNKSFSVGSKDITELESGVYVHKKKTKQHNRLDSAGVSCSEDIVRLGESVNILFSCGNSVLERTSWDKNIKPKNTNSTVWPEETSEYKIFCKNKKTYSCKIRVVDPRVIIKAIPETVVLGARTVIFWDTQDTQECVVTGPGFYEFGLHGSASTVPINSESEFKISCTAQSGDKLESSVLVGLSI